MYRRPVQFRQRSAARSLSRLSLWSMVTCDPALRSLGSARDDSFHRRLVDEVRPDMLYHAAVKDTTRQVLGAGLRALLDDQDVVSGEAG